MNIFFDFFFLFQNSGETSIMIDHALQHNTSLQNADRGISDLLGSGSSILTSLRDQRLTLKVCLLLVWLLSQCEHAGWGFGMALLKKKTTISFYWHFIRVSFLRDFWHTISYSLFHLKANKVLGLYVRHWSCNLQFLDEEYCLRWVHWLAWIVHECTCILSRITSQPSVLNMKVVSCR